MERIAHYQVLEKIGEGAMGSVFVAEDTRLDRRVALKVLLRPDPEQIARFEREAKAVAALNHPNILAIYDFGHDGDRPYIVMELLDGRTLRELLNDGPMPLRKAIGYARSLVQGLGAAHAKGVFHRDLKPTNIFVTDDGLVKIVDFGLAIVRQPLPSEGATVALDSPTAPGTVLGTIGYMAPEQVRGEPADHRSDLFAFGCLLFEMLTGSRAFLEETAVETMHAILKTDPKFELLAEHLVPEGLADIVRRCLEKRPVDRFQSARDLGFALETIQLSSLSGFGSSSEVAPAARAAVKQAGPEHRSIAVLPFANMSNDAEMEYFSDGVTEEIINALAQLPDLRVAARTSSFAFKGQNASVADVGERLSVETVLEGSVRRAGQKLRVTTQLIKVSDGYQLWAQKYDRELDDVFAIQDDIAGNIARHLRLALTLETGQHHVKPSTGSMDAYDLYLQGRYFVEQRGEGIAKGLGYLKQALARDPGFAPAYAAVAETLALLGVYGIGQPAEQFAQAQAAAVKALELDDQLADAYNARAMVKTLWEWDWDGAEAAFDRALAINPNHVRARYWKGLLLLHWVRGKHDAALVELRRAVDLDPIGAIPVYALSLALVALGGADEAVERINQALEREPTSFVLHRVLGAAHLALDDSETGIASIERATMLSMRQTWILGELGAAYAAAGRTDEARQVQEELRSRAKTAYVSPISEGVVAQALGETEDAVRHFQAAFEQRDTLFLPATVWPTAAELRKDARIQALFTQAGLQWVP